MKSKTRILPKTAARMCAVQAIYMCAVMEDFSKENIIQSLKYLEVTIADKHLGLGVKPKLKYAEEIITAAIPKLSDIDKQIEISLTKGWTLKKLGHLLLALLRTAITEILILKSAPPKVIINEYLTITRAFFEGEEVKFVNALLDKLSKQ